MRKTMRHQQRQLARFVGAVASSDMVLRGYRGVEREFVPVRQCITSFQPKLSVANVTVEALYQIVDADSESCRQTHFDFLGKQMSGQSGTKNVTLVSGFKF